MYCLYAVVGKSRELLTKDLEYPEAAVVHLGEGIGMVPLSEDLLQAIDRSAGSVPAPLEPGFEFLSRNVAAWVRALSRGATLAYTEAEFIAGEGTESAVVWRDGEVALGPLHGTGAVNLALRALGVKAPSGREEFEVVGLGRHRQPHEWLEDLRE